MRPGIVELLQLLVIGQLGILHAGIVEAFDHGVAAAGIGRVGIAFIGAVHIEIVFHNGDAGGARGADGRLHILDRFIAAGAAHK